MAEVEWTPKALDLLDGLDNGAATKRIVYLVDQLDINLPDREDLVASFTVAIPC